MHFSSKSEEFMNYFLENFNSYIQSKTFNQQKNVDNISKILYRQIRLASIMIYKKKIEKKVDSTFNHTSSLLNSHYVPTYILNFIQTKSLKKIQYKTIIQSNRNIEINFILFKNKYNTKIFDNYITWILIWLYMINNKTKCSKTLKIYIYMTPFIKELPYNQSITLSPDNANSAVTTSCVVNGEIIIFREEEWFKVLIHETFHVLGMDFSSMNCDKINKQIYKQFPITSEFNLFEAYSEFWATIINCAFCCFNLLDEDKNKQNFMLYMEFCIQAEQIFSLFQMNKVLNFIGISYKNLYTKDEIGEYSRLLYKEKTNIFSYYIVKSILLYHIGDFLNIMDMTYNFTKTETNLFRFVNFISKYKNNTKFLEDFEKLNPNNLQLDGKIKTSMRMSICEIYNEN